MTSNEPLAAILDQLAACREQITRLDAREAGHHEAVTTRLAELGNLAADLSQLPASEDPDGYQPGLPPAWWTLTPQERQEPLAHLRSWVEKVYRPGYGHLAATLAPCWAAHDLCLYALDILSELWSALYLQPRRTPGLVSAQAEYQARILPALAGQLQAETTGCGHPRNPPPVTGQPWSKV